MSPLGAPLGSCCQSPCTAHICNFHSKSLLQQKFVHGSRAPKEDGQAAASLGMDCDFSENAVPLFRFEPGPESWVCSAARHLSRWRAVFAGCPGWARSLLENDLNKFTMWQALLHSHPAAQAQYSFVCRNTPVFPLTSLRSELEEELATFASFRLPPRSSTTSAVSAS